MSRAIAQLWTAATASACDRHTMDTLGVPSPILMERAALCVAQVVRDAVAPGRSVGVLAGPGNNGGDGLAVARQLHHWGVPVVAWLVTGRGNEAVAEQRRLATAYGVDVHDGVPDDDVQPDRIWVDALLGTGASGPLRGAVGDAVRWLARAPCQCIAIDIPTGVDPDSGAVLDAAVRAQTTVTFARSKVGLHITPGRAHAGRVIVASIGLVEPPVCDDRVALLDPDVVARALKSLPAGAHKGQRGHLGVVGGSEGTIGAAVLAATAGLRAGAGLVTVASPHDDRAALAHRPEVMTAPWPDDPLDVVARATALVVGPGLVSGASEPWLRRLYREDPRPALWDASALDHVPLHSRGAERHPAAGTRIITPHPGEAARLLSRSTPDDPWTSARIQAQRLTAVRMLAAASGAVVVLKGEGSLIALPPRGQAPAHVTVATRGSAALATAGSGDVLSGIGGALLARGIDADTAASIAVHWHGLAGERLGAHAGPLALDIADALPHAWPVMLDADETGWPSLRLG